MFSQAVRRRRPRRGSWTAAGRAAAQLGGRALEHEPPVVEHVRAVGDLERERDVLLDEQHARSPARRRYARRIGSSRSTITGARPRLISSTSRSRGALTSARPTASICCSPPDSRPGLAVQAVLELGKHLEQLLVGDALPRASPSSRCSRDRQAVEQRATLGHERDAARARPCAGDAADVHAVEP